MGHVPVSDFSIERYYTKEFVNLTDVPSAEINHIRRRALLKFYLNPSRLFAIAERFPHKRELAEALHIVFPPLRVAGSMIRIPNSGFQMRFRIPNSCLLIHCTLLPVY